MNKFDIKIVKYGLLFLSKPAVLKMDATRLEITTQDGAVVLESTFEAMKKANFNSINDMWTLIANNGQKCNVVIKDEQAKSQLIDGLDSAGVKGMTV